MDAGKLSPLGRGGAAPALVWLPLSTYVSSRPLIRPPRREVPGLYSSPLISGSGGAVGRRRVAASPSVQPRGRPSRGLALLGRRGTPGYSSDEALPDGVCRWPRRTSPLAKHWRHRPASASDWSSSGAAGSRGALRLVEGAGAAPSRGPRLARRPSRRSTPCWRLRADGRASRAGSAGAAGRGAAAGARAPRGVRTVRTQRARATAGTRGAFQGECFSPGACPACPTVLVKKR